MTTTGLCYEFPLRDDFPVQLILPYDLTQEEANRIIALLNALPQNIATSLPSRLSCREVPVKRATKTHHVLGVTRTQWEQILPTLEQEAAREERLDDGAD